MEPDAGRELARADAEERARIRHAADRREQENIWRVVVEGTMSTHHNRVTYHVLAGTLEEAKETAEEQAKRRLGTTKPTVLEVAWVGKAITADRLLPPE